MLKKFEKQIDKLISQMTLREKLGQLNQPETPTPKNAETVKEQVRRGEIGSILMSVGSTAGNTPQGSIDVDFYNELQRIAVEESRCKIPLIFGRDVIHGHKTVYPIPLAMAASFDFDLVEKCYRNIAKEAAAESIHWSFAPMLDLARDPRWGRIIEGAGEDPFVASQMARATVRGFQGENPANEDSLLATAKHFVGYGAAEGGRDYYHSEISDYNLFNFYLPAFNTAIKSGAATVMSSFNDINGEPISASEYYLTKILRDYLGFEGMVVSDYAAIVQLIRNGVAKDEAEATELALKAGIDMDMWDYCYLNNGEDLVEKGKIPLELIDKAVKNVLGIKFLKGLFENPYCEKRQVDTKKHLEDAEELANRSMVLLKNENDILPLDPAKKVMVIGPYLEERRTLLGSWCIDGKAEDTKNLLEELQSFAGENIIKCETFDDIEKGMALTDTVILALGEDWDTTGEHKCVADVTVSKSQKELIKFAALKGLNTVGVFFCGRPIAMEDLAGDLKGILYAWHSGSRTAKSVVNILFGKVSPSGRLPVTMPRTSTQIPLYYNLFPSGHNVNEYYDQKVERCYIDIPATPYYPFGYGLSYTKFLYSDISFGKTKLSLDEIIRGDTFKISLEIKNIGDFDSFETLQLYIRDVVAKFSRPMRELKAFHKPFVEKGESVSVEFEVGKNQLGYYDKTGKYVIEPGEFEIFVGENCLAERKVLVEITN